MDRVDLAIILSFSAAAVAFTSLLWQVIYSIRIDRPRLVVKIEQMVFLSADGGPAQVVTVRAVNKGRRQIQVDEIALRLGRPPRRFTRLMPRWLRIWYFHPNRIVLVPEEWKQASTGLPEVVGEWSSAIARYPRDQVADAGQDVKVKRMYGQVTSSRGRRFSRTVRLEPSQVDLLQFLAGQHDNDERA